MTKPNIDKLIDIGLKSGEFQKHLAKKGFAIVKSEIGLNANGDIVGGEDMPTPPRLKESLEWDRFDKILSRLESAKSESAQQTLGRILEKLASEMK